MVCGAVSADLRSKSFSLMQPLLPHETSPAPWPAKQPEQELKIEQHSAMEGYNSGVRATYQKYGLQTTRASSGQQGF